MAIRQFLAMTPGEILGAAVLPENLGWMGCRFSSSGRGLTEIPKALPKGSLLIITDETPPVGHDPIQICEEAAGVAEKLGCCGILLDFQRPNHPENRTIAAELSQNASCPVAISEAYADGIDCPVFLSPVPPHVPPEAYFQPWRGREIWLELALDGVDIAVTKDGSSFTPVPYPSAAEHMHRDDLLCCHYSTEVSPEVIRFHLLRTKEDVQDLLNICEPFHVTTAVGLYQEFGG